MLEVVYPALLTRARRGLSRKPIKPPINVSCSEAALPGCGGWCGLPKKSRGLEGEVRVEGEARAGGEARAAGEVRAGGEARVGVGGFILLPTVPYTTGSSSGLK